MHEPGTDASLYRLLLVADRLMRAETAQCLARESLNEEQYRILLSFDGTREHTFKELRDRALTNVATLALNVDRLDQRKLVRKQIDPGHKRRAYASITHAGSDMVDQVRHEVEHAHARIESAFGETNTATLKSLLAEFLRLHGLDA
ncbi:MAG TPA: MarR family winged helix-turn-helix transcriptional regulator [Pararobbsia sp.]|jgi:DNA-binding MarR family transcriptional regulator|nr:MarR family winged helix-turn-helix transcriptional regulator [Pararobbsia sp.]